MEEFFKMPCDLISPGHNFVTFKLLMCISSKIAGDSHHAFSAIQENGLAKRSTWGEVWNVCWVTIHWSTPDSWHCHYICKSLQWRHNERDGVSNHRGLDCLVRRLFRRRSKKSSKLRVTGLCVGNSPVTGEFPTQEASNAENVSMWWRHHDPSIIDHIIKGIQGAFISFLHALQLLSQTLQLQFYMQGICW